MMPKYKSAKLEDVSRFGAVLVTSDRSPFEQNRALVIMELNAKTVFGFGLSNLTASPTKFYQLAAIENRYAAPNSACKASSLSSAIVATTVIKREISPGDNSATVRDDETTT